MTVRRLLAACGIASALFVAACAPQQFVMIPAPPVEVRKEAPLAPPAPEPAPAPAESRVPPPAAARPDNVAAPAAPQAGRPDNVVVGPPPPERDPARYAAAIARTKEAITRGTPQAAVPAWDGFEGGPWASDAIYHQGVLLQLGGDLEGARARYRRVTDNAPIHERAAANLLGLYQIRGDAAPARALVARVLPAGAAPSPAMPPALRANIAGWLLETGDLERAGRLLEGLRGRGEAGPATAWNLAILSYRRGDAADARRQASAIPPAIASLWSVAASRFAWERDDGKIPPVENVPETEPVLASLARNLSAYAAFSKGNAAEAERILSRETGRDDRPAEMLTNLGVARAEQGKWKEARQALEQAVAKKPSLPDAWLNLGIFREVYEGDSAAALECYGNYVKFNGLRKEEVAKWIDWLRKSPPRH